MNKHNQRGRTTPPRGRKSAIVTHLERVGYDLLDLAAWLDSNRRLSRRKGGSR